MFGPIGFGGAFAPKVTLAGCTTPSFTQAPTSPEPVGLDAHYVGVGDLNSDGHLDIVTTDNDSASLTILLGDGTGNFTQTPSTPFPVGMNPVTVEIADFNGDNKADLVVSNEGSNSLSVLLGNNDGTFVNAPGSPIAVGAFPRAVAIGRFNADSINDLVISNGGSNDLTILLGNGNGTFSNAAGSPVTAGSAPFHTVIGDFNGDTIADLAVAHLGEGSVRIFLGNGSGGFSQTGAAIPIGTFTAFLAMGDFNQDNKLDLAAVNRLDSNLVVLLGNGSGGFSQAPGSPYPVGAEPMAVAAGDLNLDGKLDLAVANETGGNTNILLGNGDGTFTQSAIVTKGQLPTHMALADFNEDGKLDIATSDAGDNTVTILLNTCNACASINVNPTTIATGTVGTGYSETFTAAGGASPYSVILTGTLPTGLFFTDPILSGTPTQNGSFPITVTAMDNHGCPGSRDYTLVVNCQTITVDQATIPSGTAGTTYSQTFTQTGGIGTTTFALTGTLPTGITFSGATLSGTPTQTGSFPITITATDSNGCTGNRDYTLVINCQSITVNPTTIPPGTVSTAYSQTFTQIGGIGTTTFALTGTLPAGMTFSGATLSGTPTQSGSFPITVTATDSNGCTGNRGYTLLIINCPGITVNPTTISPGTVSTAYSQTFTHTGGIGTTTFALTGTLPTGMTFSGATLSGTPTQAGSFPITVTATDANNCIGIRNYTLVINCQVISVLPATTSAGTAGTAYNQVFTANNAVGAVTFNQNGKLPAGMTFTGSTLSGTPTQTGSYPISITATDANNCSTTRNYTLVINCQTITISPTSIPAGIAGTAYNQTFTQSGGIGSIIFSQSGKLPAGLSFSGNTLSGTPTQTGSFAISITATDSNDCNVTRNYTLIVNCQSITVNPTTIPAGTSGTAYSQTFTQTGGIGTTTFSQTGVLPAGLSFSGATLSGTPTQTGSFPITVTATDSNGCSGSRNYTLLINCQGFTVNPATIPAGARGTAYLQTFTHTGGTGAVTFNLTGTLPTGITFSGVTLSGTPTQTGSFPITISAIDSNGCTSSRNYSLVINCQTITVNPATIPAGTAGSAYSQSFTQNGGIGTTTFSLTGTLPTGITFSGSALSGTPTQTGSFPITVKATDANGCMGLTNYTLVINCPALITVNPATLPNGFVGISYGTQTLSATGGIGSYTFTVSAGALPGGITLSGATLSGTPTTAGTFNFTIQAADGNGCVGTRAYTVNITIASGLQFYPLPTPVRLLDTRTGATGCFTPGAQIPGGTSRTQSAAGACSIPANAKAITGNIGTVQSGGGYLTVYPGDAAQPTVANSNYLPNEILNNVFTIGLGVANGDFKIFVTTNTDVVVDITGYYAPPGVGGLYFHPLPKPIRLLETRIGQPGCLATGTPLAGGVDSLQQGTTTCGGVTIPNTALALFGNATTVGPVAGGYLTLFPANAARPFVANGNYTAGQILNSPFTVGLSPTGQFKIFTTAQTDMVIDVHGYYSADAVDVNGQGLLLTPLPTPVRLLDTRVGFSGCFTPGAPLQTGVEQSQLARGTCTIGASAQAIVATATVVFPPSNGYLTLWPSNTTKPLVASSNWVANQVFNRYFTVGLGNDGKFKMFASNGTDLVIDVSGYFAP